MIEAFRITPERDAGKAFSGEAAKKWGGRWNSPGVAIVYTACSRSLAMLEVLVHMRGAPGGGLASRPYSIYPLAFDENLVEELPDASLPAGWDSEPASAASQSIGAAWVSAATGPVLSVPSVIVPEERNYLLNPHHARFAEIKIGAPAVCRFDPRLM